MALRKAQPLTFSPHGASDSVDGTNVFEGAMQSLQNLIPDPSTANLWQCRPAAQQLPQFFSAFTTPGLVSALQIIGNFAYGLVATGFHPGHDQPFVYNLVSNTLVPISGITAANVPTSPPSTGPWTPPSMAAIATKIIITHPGFNFSGGFAFGVLDISNPAAPTWTATNTTTNALAALPNWVAAYNGRAVFLVNPATAQPAAYFTDVLAPTVITNANQIVTFDDNQTLTCAAGLGLFSQLGGVVQALMIFKNTANIYQITGDPLLGNFSRNSLNIATGTNAPNSVTPTPLGLAFLAPDGLRIIDFYARVGQPIGVDGNGINAPFIYTLNPSRAQASSNQNVLRVSVQNGLAPGSPNQEWWFDLSRQKWSGPHTFPASMIDAYNNTFIVSPIGVNGTLFQSDVAQSGTSTFIENGQQMTFNWTTAMLPDPKMMSFFSMVESSLNVAMVSGQNPIAVKALDQNGAPVGSFAISPVGAGTIWGQFVWGQAVWGGATSALFPRSLEWTQPVVFRRLQIQATGICVGGLKIGDLFLRYQPLGYMFIDQAPAVVPTPGTILVSESGQILTTEGGQVLVPP